MVAEVTGPGSSSGGLVAHLSTASRVPLSTILGGSEPQKMTPELANNIEVLNEPTACRFLSDGSSMEVNLLGRSLDILASAELPGSGEEIQVAIENQYGVADPDHFGRLVGWYMPETGARMGVLVAEGFEPQLIKTVSDGQVVTPEHGLWLVEACGFQVGETRLVTYQTRACSLPRAERLRRESAFARGVGSGSNRKEADAEAERLARVLFAHIQETSASWLRSALSRSSTTTGYYRWIEDNGSTCHVELFVGTDRISIGSCYLKSNHNAGQLDRLTAANTETEVDPAPARRYLRGAWWDLRTDVGRNTPKSSLSPTLGFEIEKAFESIRDAVEAHQGALLSAVAESPDLDSQVKGGPAVGIDTTASVGMDPSIGF